MIGGATPDRLLPMYMMNRGVKFIEMKCEKEVCTLES